MAVAAGSLSGSDGIRGHVDLSALGISFLVAAAVIILFRKIGQTAVVACIVGGVLLQLFGDRIPKPHIDTLDDLQMLGIILLLVLAGMQVQVEQLLQSWRMLLVGVAQICIGLVFAGALGAQAVALSWLSVEGYAGIAVFALCLTLSSTAIVVEGLKARGATQTPYGQVLLELMLLQDIVAVLGMSLLGLPGEGDPTPGRWGPLSVLLQFVGFTALALILGRTVLVKIIERIRYDESLLLIFVLGWASGLAGLAFQNGFSPTLAGFLAGVALSFTPHRSAIEHRIEPLKVFGITIYFIFLGVVLPLKEVSWALFWPVVLSTVLIVVVRPLCSVWLARLGGMNRRESNRFGVSIGQGSEFSMILAASALHAELFDEAAFLVVVFASVLSMVISSWVQLSFQRRGSFPADEVDPPPLSSPHVGGQ